MKTNTTTVTAPVPVSTMLLTADERARVDAAGEGLYRALHRDTADDVIRDLRERGAGAVVVSASTCDERSAQRLARMVHEFPCVPTVALLSRFDGPASQGVLYLGRSGIRTLVDVRQPSGWRALRAALSQGGRPAAAGAIAQLAQDLAGAPGDCWRFFEQLFLCPPAVLTVRQLARRLDVVPSTLMSRFFRAHLPAPKRYLATARLVRAAHLFESPGLSVSNVADELEYSSPQSFGRHVRTLLKLTAVQFRERYDGDGMMQRFRAEIVLPHITTLRGFAPLTAPPGWTPRETGQPSARGSMRATISEARASA